MEPMETVVEFRAGLLTPVENKLAPDTRKGLVQVAQSEDSLVHVLWFERVGTAPKEQPERDSVVFPGECSLKEVPNQPRVYVLHFPADPSRDEFFWMQEPKAERDAGLVTRFNAAVNGEPVPPDTAQSTAPAAPSGSAPAAAQDQGQAGTSGSGGGGASDLAALLGAALASAGAPPTQGQDPRALAALMSQMSGQQGTKRMRADEGPGLQDVLHPEALVPLLQGPEALNALAEHLPEEHRSTEQLIATIQSPQFRQQMALFGAAIQTGQLDMLHQFGLHAKGFSIADFLEAIQDQANQEKAEKSKSQSQGPEPMER